MPRAHSQRATYPATGPMPPARHRNVAAHSPRQAIGNNQRPCAATNCGSHDRRTRAFHRFNHSVGSNVRLLLGSLFALAVAAAVGLGTPCLSLTQGIAYGGVSIGAWTAWPKSGPPGIDPYARAVVARSGELPVGSGDGVAFHAPNDDDSRPLDGRCDVALSGI